MNERATFLLRVVVLAPVVDGLCSPARLHGVVLGFKIAEEGALDGDAPLARALAEGDARHARGVVALLLAVHDEGPAHGFEGLELPLESFPVGILKEAISASVERGAELLVHASR